MKKEPQLLVQSDFRDIGGTLSPDSRFLAYASNKSGDWQVYICPFPAGTPTEQISILGGEPHAWGPEGDDFFFLGDADGKRQVWSMMHVNVDTADGFRAGKPQKLFELPEGIELSGFNVSNDGQRFLVIQNVDIAEIPTITAIQNWSPEFKDAQ